MTARGDWPASRGRTPPRDRGESSAAPRRRARRVRSSEAWATSRTAAPAATRWGRRAAARGSSPGARVTGVGLGRRRRRRRRPHRFGPACHPCLALGLHTPQRRTRRRPQRARRIFAGQPADVLSRPAPGAPPVRRRHTACGPGPPPDRARCRCSRCPDSGAPPARSS